MIEQLRNTVSHIVIESTIESVVLWLVALAFLRWSKASSPRIRQVVYLMPLVLPVLLTTIFHVVIPVQPFTLPEFKLLEPLVGYRLESSVPAVVAFLLVGSLGVAASMLLMWQEWLALRRAHDAWRRQKREETPLWQRCEVLLTEVARRAGVGMPRVVLADGVSAGSLAFGWWNYVFIPVTLARQLDEEELEALFAHEMVHISSKAGFMNLVARSCRNLMVFNPLAHWALAGFEGEQEEATDDSAVGIGVGRTALASCLLKAYRLGEPRGRVAVTGFLGYRSRLERRVRRMLSPTAVHEPPKIAWFALGAVSAVVSAGMIISL